LPEPTREVAALELQRVSVSYGGLRALREVSLVVPEGSVVALLGANGAGKSTALRAISGIVGIEQGRILVGGVRTDRRPAYAVARLGVVHVPEGRGIFPSLTVRENLDVAPVKNGEDPLEGAINLFPILGKRLGIPARNLSGGEQQMLALARALLSEPRLLLVDEISMGLAPIIVAELFQTLKERAALGTSILLVEQYVETALDLADYVYVLDKGRVVDVGQPSDIRRDGLVATYMGGAR
jgi:branched-chain amino acid transport system ATP-binding protein